MQQEYLEERGRKAFDQFWEVWCSRDLNSAQLIAGHTVENFSGLGTNIGERWLSRDDLLRQLREEWRQIPVPYKYCIEHVDAFLVSPDTLLVMGDIELSMSIKGRTIALDSVRNTQVYIVLDGELWLAHWHCSVPDGGMRGEVVPGSFDPEAYDDTTVLFCDFVDYTRIAEVVPERTLVNEFKTIYSDFDSIMEDTRIESLEIVGDGYLAVSGFPDPVQDHADRCVVAAKKLLDYLQERNRTSEVQWDARIGIHSGRLGAGVIGRRKFGLHVFGDTVNIASRLETASERNRINVSAKTCALIRDRFPCEYRGKIKIKGKEDMEMYYVL